MTCAGLHCRIPALAVISASSSRIDADLFISRFGNRLSVAAAGSVQDAFPYVAAASAGVPVALLRAGVVDRHTLSFKTSRKLLKTLNRAPFRSTQFRTSSNGCFCRS